MTNIFKKYTHGVYAMQSESHNLMHGDSATIRTKHGKEVAVTVWKRLGYVGAFSLYSVVREDGKCKESFLRSKAEKRRESAERADARSQAYYERSRKDADFLSLGEPIKVGHHSERRHRKAIEDANKYIGKSCAESDKAEDYTHKAETLESRAEQDIALDTPDSIARLQAKIAMLEDKRATIKVREHRAFELSNIGATIRRYGERLETARKLWELEYYPAPAKNKEAEKQAAMNAKIAELRIIFAFSREQFDAQKVEGTSYVPVGFGGYCPAENILAFKEFYKAL